MQEKSNNLKLLENTFRKVSQDKEFIAYYLHRYGELENKKINEIISELNCDEENFYRLGLCNTPNQNIAELNEISAYVGVSALSILNILKHIDTIEEFSNTTSDQMLIAARDKVVPKNSKKSKRRKK